MRYTPLQGGWLANRGCATGICIAVSFQFTAFAVMRSHMVHTQCDSVSLLWGEVAKLLLSVSLVSSDSVLWNDVHTSIVPTVCFCVMNLLSVWALRRISASLFVLILQLKMVWTALFSWIMLGRLLSVAQVLTLAAMSVGIVNFDMSATASVDMESFWPVAALVLETALSGFSSAWTQMSFASNTNTMWVRNVQLAFFSCAVYIATACWNECSFVPTPTGLLFGAMSALGGVLVAMTLLHVGAIEKTITTNVASVLTFSVEGLFFNTSPPLQKVLAALNVFLICWVFAVLPRPEDEIYV